MEEEAIVPCFNTSVSTVETKALRGPNDLKLIETLIEITGSARN